jgi:hypothetical protein
LATTTTNLASCRTKLFWLDVKDGLTCGTLGIH